MRLANKIALITGAGSGIGRTTAELFANEGASIVVVDIIRERARETVDSVRGDGGEAIALHADIRDADMVEEMISETRSTYGRLDVLINNAAIASGDDILSIDEATWDENLSVILKGTFLCSKAALPVMIEQRSGSIVNIASVNALAGLGEEPYSAAKAGVINLTQNMAVKYGRFGVRANCICPGTIRTPIWQPRVEADPQIFDRLAKWYPLGRIGEPEDPAKAALFLASEDAGWITGATLPVDGGFTAGNFRLWLELGQVQHLL
jgi:meso-butanediol dehydrogenase/(S,S)-butanediol dehydrogenase/diacetyl reductase